MAFWNFGDKDTPPELKDKKPEDIVAMLKAGQDAQAEVATLKASIEEKDGKINELSTDVASVKEQLTRINAAPPPPPKDPPKAPSFLVDEDAAFAARIQPVVAGQYALMGQVARTNAISEIDRGGDDETSQARKFVWNRFRTETEELFKQMNPVQAANTGSYATCVDIIVARHLKEINAERAKNGGSLFVEAGGGGGGRKPEESRYAMTDQEKKIADRMGVPETAYNDYYGGTK